MSILVTGGAGFIGSHVVQALRAQGEEIIVVDDLSSGDATRIKGVDLVEIELSAGGAQRALESVMRSGAVDAVVHLAAQKQVGASMKQSILYYRQNVGG